MEFFDIADDCVEHIMQNLSGIDVVRFGLTNKRYLEIVKRYLNTSKKVVLFKLPMNISLASLDFYGYYITRFQLRTPHLSFYIYRDSVRPVDITSLHFCIEAEYNDPYSVYGICSDGIEFERRSFAYHASLLNDGNGHR